MISKHIALCNKLKDKKCKWNYLLTFTAKTESKTYQNMLILQIFTNTKRESE